MLHQNVSIVSENGRAVTMGNSSSIPNSVLVEMFNQRHGENATLEECVRRQRGKLIPDGYIPFPFRTNTPESYLDQLRSLVATYTYRSTIAYWNSRGVDFDTFMYIPEVDNITGEIHHDRADHCHLLKRIAGN